MFTELTFAILKYGFLVLLWVFVWCAIRSLRCDIEVFSLKKKHFWKKKSRLAAHEVTTAPVVQKQISPVVVESENLENSELKPTLLVVIDGPLAGSSYPLNAAGVTLGRAASNTVVLNDEFVSSYHARVYYNQTVHAWVLEDLGSTNGTLIGHNRISEPVILTPRTSVRIGATMFELR